MSNVDWQVTTDRSGVLQTLLIAQLRVEDSLGTTVTATAQVPLVIERNTRIVDRSDVPEENRERISYSLLPFPHNSSELTPRNDAVIREAAHTIRGGARITVTGYSGGEGSTPELSRARADRAATRLNALLRDLGIRDAAITTATSASEAGTPSGDVEITIEQVLPRGVMGQG
jgi:hypothetical protein